MLRRTVARAFVLPRALGLRAPAVSAPMRTMFKQSAVRLDDAKADAPATPEVQAIIDGIMKLNVMQSVELVKCLKTTFGYSDAAFMAAPAGAAPAAAAAPAEEAAKPAAAAKTTVSLKLEGYDAKDKVKIIKEVRVITGKGLKEAKELVEAAPTVVKADMKKEEAEKLMKTLEEAGAKVVLE